MTGTNRKRLILLCVFFALFYVVPTLAAPGRWVEDEKGWWYQNADHTYPADTWLQSGDSWYHFDESGYMQSGWYEEDGKKYWLSESGAMLHDAGMTIHGLPYVFDSSGVGSLSWSYQMPVEILPDSDKSNRNKEIDVFADQILAQIVNDAMTEKEKATAIYQWMRANMRYVASASDPDWITAAYHGLSRRRGDCYTYFSTAAQLLSRIGIPSIEVRRNKPNDSLEHMWNLIYCDDGWYHFDVTPRFFDAPLCLVTDAQLDACSAAHGGGNQFDHSLYPPTP